MTYSNLAIEAERGLWTEIQAAAEDLAHRGLTGKRGDPLPNLMSTRAVNRINADPVWFQERVRHARRESALRRAEAGRKRRMTMRKHCSDGWTISEQSLRAGRQTRRKAIARAGRKYGVVRVQDSYHGAGHYSVQIFAGGELVADVPLS